MLGNPENKPSFLSDKSLEQAFKYLGGKKFPNVDTKVSAVRLLYINRFMPAFLSVIYM
jgi:hypothetical protein